MSNELSSSLETLFGQMENFITTKTVVSDPITIGDVILVPLVDVSFGVAAGAYDSSADNKKDNKDMGGGGLGAKISPSAVIVITDGTAKLISVNSQLGLNKLLEVAPDVLSKIPSLFGGKDKKSAKREESEGRE